MKIQQLNRKLHYWGALVCALPILVVIITGLLLLLKKELPWVQPATQQVVQVDVLIGSEQMLKVVQQLPELEISGWQDIDRIDMRPSKGVAKIIAKNHMEAQLDLSNGRVLQVAYRRSDIIESLHDGSFFGLSVKYIVFLTSGLILLLLWLTGLYLFFLPFYRRHLKSKK